MRLFSRQVLASSALLLATMATNPAFAEEFMDDQVNTRPSAGAMALDVVVARPMLLALTLGGTAAFVASLPFTALGGNVEEAAKTLVLGPAKSTFTRCMGCTATQDALKDRDVSSNNQ